MEKGNSNFLLGVGLGSLLGAVAYKFSRSSKAKKWKTKACCAMHEIGDKAEALLDNAKGKVAETTR